MSQSPSRSRSRRLWMVAWLAWGLVGWYGNAAAQQFSFRQYAQSDGLTNLAAGYLVTDPGGDLWVGTDGGTLVDDRTSSTWTPDIYAHGLLFKFSALAHDGVPRYYFGQLLQTSSLPDK